MGKPAADILTAPQPVTIRGITSRGIFLETNSQCILFLSSEKFKGPLNINLDPGSLNLSKLLEIHENGFITAQGSLYFPGKLTIRTTGARIWSAAELRKGLHPKEFALADSQLIQQVSKKIDDRNSLLEGVVLMFSGVDLAGNLPIDHDLRINLENLFTSLLRGDHVGTKAAVDFFIGRGSGLTPSGDDLILGLLFSLFCLQNYHALNLDGIKNSIAESTPRTTKISACLITCAGIGEVDERLARSFEVLVNNNHPNQRVVTGLLGWGNSSGIDALAGMALGLQIVKSQGRFGEKNIFHGPA